MEHISDGHGDDGEGRPAGENFAGTVMVARRAGMSKPATPRLSPVVDLHCFEFVRLHV